MPLETFDYIANLDQSNPTATDPKSQGDDHLRGIKKAAIQSFPNINAPVTATPAELNRVVGVTSPVQTQLNTLGTTKYDKAGGTVTGEVNVQPASGDALVSISRAAGSNRRMRGRTGAVMRWSLDMGDSAAEAGSNAGSDFALSRYNDAGSLLAVALKIARGTGAVTIPGGGTLGGAFAFTGTVEVPAPTQPSHATTQQWVADAIAAVAGGTPSLFRDSRTSNTALNVPDVGKLIDIISGTFAQTITAVATVGNGWWCYVRNSGAGIVTLTPPGGALINGLATRTLYPGNAVLLQCDGVGFHTMNIGALRKPIFEAANDLPGSILEEVANGYFQPVPGGAGQVRFASTGSMLIAAPNAAIGFVGSTTDGRVFTSRAMPSASAWMPVSDGSGFMAVVSSGTGTAYSASGTSWAAATALPGNAQGSAQPAAVPGRYLARGSATTSTLYLTQNNGGSWSTETAPAINLNVLLNVGALFIARAASSGTYYTSTTGTTGSWTARTLPGGATSMRQDFDGSLVAWNGTSAWRSTDAINWVALPVTLPTTEGAVTINGVYLSGGVGNFYTCHRGQWAQRTYQGQGLGGVASVVAAIAGVYLISRDASNGQVIVIDTNPGQGKPALFS